MICEVATINSYKIYGMSKYVQIFLDGYRGYASYLWQEISEPSVHNYFYWLVLVSLFFLILEWSRPWRIEQPRFRKDFWLDAFYMFFNFFLFSLIIYNAASDVVVTLINDGIRAVFHVDLQSMNPMRSWPLWSVLLTGFVIRDFIQWWVHRLLHRSEWLWEFHKVHHSVEQMGFAAQLRYHWMENIVYRSIEYLPLALLGVGLYDFFVIHIFSLAIGHFNHANITVPQWLSSCVLGALVGVAIAWGAFEINLVESAGILSKLIVVLISTVLSFIVFGSWMRTVFNSPEMHIWHHAYELPGDRRYGVNFGLSLAIWDYIFGTAYVPASGRDIRLGFPGIEDFPKDFISQNIHGVAKSSTKERHS